MKKRLSALLFIGVTALSLCIISAHAAQHQPSFFIPQKVLDKMHQPEKLPPIPKMNYGNRQTQNTALTPTASVQNSEPSQKSTDTKRITAEKAAERQQHLEQNVRNEKQLQAERERLQKIKAEKSAQQKNEKENNLQTSTSEPHHTTQTTNAKNIGTQPRKIPQNSQSFSKAEVTPPKPTVRKAEPKQQTMPLNNSERTFDDIIADYKHDILGISKGKAVNNPRLRDVLQDYSDERHIL